MAEEHHVKGYDGFVQFMKDFDTKDKIINILFSGEKDEQVSWRKKVDKIKNVE